MPRDLVGLSSAKSVGASTLAAPTPRPHSSRPATIMPALVAQADSRVPSVSGSTRVSSAVRRPRRSESGAQPSAPDMPPMTSALTAALCPTIDSDRSAAIAFSGGFSTPLWKPKRMLAWHTTAVVTTSEGVQADSSAAASSSTTTACAGGSTAQVRQARSVPAGPLAQAHYIFQGSFLRRCRRGRGRSGCCLWVAVPVGH